MWNDLLWLNRHYKWFMFPDKLIENTVTWGTGEVTEHGRVEGF